MMALVFKTITAGLGLSLAFTAAALGGNGDEEPIPAPRQTRLLERFGDEGIDADGDGTITRQEERDFRAKRGAQAQRKGKRQGRRGHPRPMFGPGGRMGHLLKELDMLQSPDAPAWFTADRFADADRDQNGSLDAEEWSSFSDNGQARVIEQIINIDPSADANKDGDLSDQELQALADTHDKRTRAQMLKRHPDADTDGDGTLSDSEVEAVKSVHLSAILGRHPDADLNADGVLTGDEFHVFTMTRHGPGAGPPGEFPPSPEWILERHPEADTDGDGELSDEEIEAFRESNPHGPRGGGPRKQGRID